MLEVRFNTKRRLSVAIGYCILLVVLAISGSLLEAQDQSPTAHNPLPFTFTVSRGNFAKSPSQDIFVIGLEDGTVALWDFQTRGITRTLDGYFDLSDSTLTWSPDGRLIAARSFDTIIWDMETGELLPSWGGCCDVGYGVPEGIHHLAISPDSTILINAPAAHVWDIASGELLHTLSDHLLSIDKFLISPDGSTVMADPYLFGPALVWDMQSGELVHRISFATTLAISPDGSMLAVSVIREEKSLYRVSILDSDTYEELQGFDVAFFPYKLTWTPDNLMLLVGVAGWSWVSEDLIDNGFKVISWDIESRQEKQVFGITQEMQTSYILSDEEQLLAVDSSSSPNWALVLNMDTLDTYAIDPRSGENLGVLQITSEAIVSFELSPNGERIATITDEGTAVVWNVETGARLGTLSEEGFHIDHMIWLSDSETIAAVGRDDEVLFWELP